MIFDWYKILNKTEFEAADIPSREVEVVLSGIGLKTVLVTKGNEISLVYEGVMLSPGMLDKNPFIFGGFAAYLDASNDLWLGVLIP